MKQTTTTWYRCLGRGAEPPCEAAERFEQAGSGGAAEAHTKRTGHGTTTTIRAEVGAAWMAASCPQGVCDGTTREAQLTNKVTS